jgi:hypothetical protein
MNRYYLVGFSLLAVFAALVIIGFLVPKFPFRVAVLGIASSVLRYLIFAGIGYGAYYLARKHVERRKAVLIGTLAAIGAFLAYLLFFTFLLPIILG